MSRRRVRLFYSIFPGTAQLTFHPLRAHSHPGPILPDGSFKGRGSAEIDIIEATVNLAESQGEISQSAQWAPFSESPVLRGEDEGRLISTAAQILATSTSTRRRNMSSFGLRTLARRTQTSTRAVSARLSSHTLLHAESARLRASQASFSKSRLGWPRLVSYLE